VEYAPFQKVPATRTKKLPMEGTIEKGTVLTQLYQLYKSWHCVIYVRAYKNNHDAHEASKKADEAAGPVVTALMAFLCPPRSLHMLTSRTHTVDPPHTHTPPTLTPSPPPHPPTHTHTHTHTTEPDYEAFVKAYEEGPCPPPTAQALLEAHEARKAAAEAAGPVVTALMAFLQHKYEAGAAPGGRRGARGAPRSSASGSRRDGGRLATVDEVGVWWGGGLGAGEGCACAEIRAATRASSWGFFGPGGGGSRACCGSTDGLPAAQI
jgi:hypothetical protein